MSENQRIPSCTGLPSRAAGTRRVRLGRGLRAGVMACAVFNAIALLAVVAIAIIALPFHVDGAGGLAASMIFTLIIGGAAMLPLLLTAAAVLLVVVAPAWCALEPLGAWRRPVAVMLGAALGAIMPVLVFYDPTRATGADVLLLVPFVVFGALLGGRGAARFWWGTMTPADDDAPSTPTAQPPRAESSSLVTG